MESTIEQKGYVLDETDLQRLQEVGLVVTGKYFDVCTVTVFNGNCTDRREIPVSPVRVICDRKVATAFVPTPISLLEELCNSCR